ncbi:MAG: phosphohistidine phosphatase SixA [Candidatus Zixiibacteriota bacterium]|nr:MAG: phosphohistidine phosphatase SixA [candidate division Zixibacteria bacterium]
MKVYLMQHAEALTKEEDPERALSEKGRLQIDDMASFVKDRIAHIPTIIYHSGKTRARQTAELFAQEVMPDGVVASANGLEPLADPAVWAERLTQIHEDVMLVGHLPHIGKLVSFLVTGAVTGDHVAVRNAGIICLESDDARRWTVCWTISPDVLK